IQPGAIVRPGIAVGRRIAQEFVQLPTNIARAAAGHFYPLTGTAMHCPGVLAPVAPLFLRANQRAVAFAVAFNHTDFNRVAVGAKTRRFDVDDGGARMFAHFLGIPRSASGLAAHWHRPDIWIRHASNCITSVYYTIMCLPLVTPCL